MLPVYCYIHYVVLMNGWACVLTCHMYIPVNYMGLMICEDLIEGDRFALKADFSEKNIILQK